MDAMGHIEDEPMATSSSLERHRRNPWPSFRWPTVSVVRGPEWGSSRLGISLEPADFQVPNVSVFGGGRNFPDKLDGNGEKSRNL